MAHVPARYTRVVSCVVVFGIKPDGTTISLALNESAEEVASALRGREKSLVDFETKTGEVRHVFNVIHRRRARRHVTARARRSARCRSGI